MNSHLDTFDDFVDDLLSSDFDLLKGELDFLIIQHLLQSIDLDVMKNVEFDEIGEIAAWFMLMNFLYEKFWVPFFGNILSQFIFLIEGKKTTKNNKKLDNKF